MHRELIRLLAALAVALAAGLVVLWPAVGDPRAAADLVLGNWRHPDNLSNQWLLAWVAERVVAGESLLHNELYYWPIGDAPLLAGNGMEGFPYLPWHHAFGWPRAVPLFALATLCFNGVAAWALARAAGAAQAGALVAAGVVALHPYGAAELDMGHFSQVDLGWLLLGLAGACRAATTGSVRVGLLAGVAGGIAGNLYWFHGVFWGIGTVVLLMPGPGALRARRLEALRPLGAALAVAFVVALPWAWVSLTHLDAVPGMDEGFPSEEALSAGLSAPWPWRTERAWQAVRAFPVLLLPAALWGLRRGRETGAEVASPEAAGLGRRLGLLWVVAFLLALGPAWHLFTALHGLAAPLRRFWWPYRYGVLMLACAATLAARGIGGRRVLAGLLLLSLPAQLAAFGDLRQVKASPLQTPMARWPVPTAPGVVLEPPLAPAASADNTALVYQLAHGQPMLGGHAQWVERVRPDAWDAFVAADPFLSALIAWESGQGASELPLDALQALEDQGLRWLVLNPQHFSRKLQAYHRGWRLLARELAGPPVARLDGIELYDLHARTPTGPVRPPTWRWPPGLEPAGPTTPLAGALMHGPLFGGAAAIDPPDEPPAADPLRDRPSHETRHAIPHPSRAPGPR